MSFEIKAIYQGVTTPIQTLYDEIHKRGWQVTKLGQKDGLYVAKAKSPYGDEVERTSRDAASAVSLLLQFIVRKEFIRQPTAAQHHLGMWKTTWVDQLDEIAQAYADAPVFEHKAAAAWKALADDSVARAKVLQTHLHVEVVDDPEPYKTVSDMIEDIHRKKHLLVSRAGAQHPVWTTEQVVAFRTVHDVVGHAVSGGDFTWQGTNLATAAHMPLLTEEAQRALFVETVGRGAYITYFRGYGESKICFLDDFLEGKQDLHNDDAHAGVHPDHTLPPVEVATVPKSSGVRRDPNHNWDSGEEPLPDNAYLWGGDPLGHVDTQNNARLLDTGWHSWTNPDGQPDFERQKQAVSNALRATLLSPGKNLKWNAVHYQDLAHVPYHISDPMVYHNALEKARSNWNGALGQDATSRPHFAESQDFIKWYRTQHKDLPVQQAIEHAERELFHLQAECEEQAQSKSPDMGASEVEERALALLKRRLKGMTHPKPNLGDNERTAAQIVDAPEDANSQYDMNRRPFVYVPHRDTIYLGDAGQLHGDMTEGNWSGHPSPLEPGEHLANPCGAVYLNKGKVQFLNPGDTSLYPHVLGQLAQHTGMKPVRSDEIHWGPIDPSTFDDLDLGLEERYGSLNESNEYGGHLAQHSKAIANVARKMDVLTRAGLEDVKRHGGSGRHFRNVALGLGIPGLTPKATSFAWHLLNPMTSQLASIDQHHMEMLGHDHASEMNNRDYFKFERELMAARDAAGYGQMPLGQFSNAIWDNKRMGEGQHQDYSTLRVENPLNYAHVDWDNHEKKYWNAWEPQPWWTNTQDSRDRAAQDFDQTQGVHNPRNAIPFQDEYTRTNAPIIIQASEPADEFHYALGVPEETIKRIAEWVGTLDLGDAEEIIEPEEYHITIAYAPSGWNDMRAHHMVKNFNLSGMKFTAKGLAHFNQNAIVIELESPAWKDSVQPIINRLKTLDLDISEFEGGPKAHITIAYGPTKPRVKSPLALSFRGERGYVSTPRGLGKTASLDGLDLGLDNEPSGWGADEHFAQPWVGDRNACKWCGGHTEYEREESDQGWPFDEAEGQYCEDCGREQDSPEHALAWTPGKWGKGYFNKDGLLHTWNTDRSWAPIHTMYQMYHGGHPSQDHAAFQINPAGEVRLWGNPEIHQEQMDNTRKMVTSIDPRLKSEEAAPYWGKQWDPDRWQHIGNVLPGVACNLHNWPDCPLCAEENEAEHDPAFQPTNDFDEAKRVWYNDRKEPGLVNPPDPFVDLKGPFQAKVAHVNAHSDYSGFDS